MSVDKYKNISLVKVSIAIFQSIIYFLLILVVSFLSSLLIITENESHEKTFESQFEKYIVVAVGVSLIVPFTLSNVLILGILQKNDYVIKIWLQSSISSSSVIITAMLTSGIYIVVKGTLYIGCSLICVAVILGGFAVYFALAGRRILNDILAMGATTNPFKVDAISDDSNSNDSNSNGNV